MTKFIADTLLMVEPISFGFNESAAKTNSFQNRIDNLSAEEIQHKALHEFIGYVDLLRSHGIKVIVFKDQKEPFTPDSIFPNNWFSTDPFDNTLYTFPMANKNRADERRKDILEKLIADKKYKLNDSLLAFESQEKYLEGTGSLVLDHQNKLAYACISPRTNLDVLNQWCAKSDYQHVSFFAYGSDGTEVYHTNVVMTMADEYAIICLESILDEEEREFVIDALVKRGNKSIIDISMDQMNKFAGNMLQVSNEAGEKFLIMSETAYDAMEDEQLYTITETFKNKILAPQIKTIETIGGGSARCMIAEIF